MPKIMVIDDDVELVEDLSAMLKAAGHTVTTFCRIEGAVERLAQDKPDLLVLDVMFPEDPSAGLSLAIKVRQQPETRGIPVILLTGVNQEFPLELSAKDIDPKWMPVQDFLEKPVDAQKLLKKIDTILSGRQSPGKSR